MKFENKLPVAPLRICSLESCKELGQRVNNEIVNVRKEDYEMMKGQHDDTFKLRGYDRENYLVNCQCPRFSSGEAKGVVTDSVRGTDLFIMTDVTNYSLTYNMCGIPNHMSPDDHYADLKRIISICKPSAHRVHVIMPFLYESRQHKRSKRESLDCALVLEELEKMGVDSITTFDAHDPRVMNAIPMFEFNNFMPTYQFLKALFKSEPDLEISKQNVIVISPDEGAMNRAVYLANNIGVDVGMFYKRRDYTTVVNGRNPIIAHEYLGTNVEGKTVIIVDDMIASGESMLDTCKKLKESKAKRVIALATFGLFTSGFKKFDEYYEKGFIDRVITTNLNYKPAEIYLKPWYIEADMTKFLGNIINSINHDESISDLMNPTEKIQAAISNFNASHHE